MSPVGKRPPTISETVERASPVRRAISAREMRRSFQMRRRFEFTSGL